jgi:hypothetical protein
MKIASSGLIATPLYKAYFGQNSATSALTSSRSGLNSDAIVSQLGDVKSKLLTLAARAKELTERATTQSVGSSENVETIPTPTTPPGDVSVVIDTENSNKPLKFANQITKALSRAYRSEDGKLLRNKNLQGDVKVTLQDGENEETFTIRVDKNTTAKSFVDEFNSKANGKASAELNQITVNGKSRFFIDVKGAAGSPTLVDDGLDEADVNEGDVSEADAAQFEKDVKKFVSDLNGLVSAVTKNKDGISSLDSNVGLISSIQDLVKGLESDDGSVKLSSFVKENASGGYNVNGGAAREAFLNNSEGVISMLNNLSGAISGEGGLTRNYAAYGGSLDKISSVVKVIAQVKSGYERDGLSNQNEQVAAERQQNLQNLANYAGKLTSLKAS